jgi:hypothetical protein
MSNTELEAVTTNLYRVYRFELGENDYVTHCMVCKSPMRMGYAFDFIVEERFPAAGVDPVYPDRVEVCHKCYVKKYAPVLRMLFDTMRRDGKYTNEL